MIEFIYFADELEKIAAQAGNMGQFWEEIGGPHLAKGGSHKAFAKLIDEAGFSEKKKERLMRMAEERYKPGFNESKHQNVGASWDEIKKQWGKSKESPPDSAPFGRDASGRPNANPGYEANPGYREEYHADENYGSRRANTDPSGKALSGAGALLAAASMGYILAADRKTKSIEAPNKLHGRVGAIAGQALPLATLGYMLGNLTTGGSNKGRAIGSTIGAGLGTLAGELAFRKANFIAEKDSDVALIRSALFNEKSKERVKREAQISTAGWARKDLPRKAIQSLVFGLMGTGSMQLGANLAGSIGSGAFKKYQKGLTYEKLQDKLERENQMIELFLPSFSSELEKIAFSTSQYSGPIEGPKTAKQESSMPAFQQKPKLAFSPTGYGDTGGFVDFHQVSSQPGFKRPKLTAPVEKTAASIETLQKALKRIPVTKGLEMAHSGGTITTSPGGTFRELAKSIASSAKTKFKALSPEGKKAINITGVLHEAFERQAVKEHQAGQQFGNAAFHKQHGHFSPSVILRENNLLANMQGSGSEEARRVFSGVRRKHEVPELQYNLEKFDPRALQEYGTYGSKKIPKAFQKNLTKEWSSPAQDAFRSDCMKLGGALTPSGLTPKARLSSSMQIGAPKVSAPSGPSIAEIAKPRGMGTGHGLPGAFKNVIG